MQNQLGKLENAFGRLMAALTHEQDEFVRDSVIKRFEFTFELLWKSIKRLAEAEGLECQSPKTCFKVAFQLDLIQEESVFLDMLEFRNLTSHTYDEDNAVLVHAFIADHGVTALASVIERLRLRMST